MGADGLAEATAVAVLAANYVARRLRDALPGALHRARAAWSPTSASSTCARITKETGVTVDDVAKRLIDYGFHAPTMSFPVAGTLMVEPTESRGPRRARPLLRRDDRHPGRDRRGGGRGVARRGQPAAQRPAHRRVPWPRRVGPPVPARGGGLPVGRRRAPRSTGRRCAASTAPTATATWSAPARRWRPSPRRPRGSRGRTAPAARPSSRRGPRRTPPPAARR